MLDNPLQQHENDALSSVLIYEGIVQDKSSLYHPASSLLVPYSLNQTNIAPVNADMINRIEWLKSNEIKVNSIEQLILHHCSNSDINRKKLIDIAMNSLQYQLSNSNDQSNLESIEQSMLSNEYKLSVIESMTLKQMMEVVVMRPTILLNKNHLNHPLTLSHITYQPLTHLTFQRNFVVTTRKGVILANSNGRNGESDFLSFFFDLIGVPVIARVESNAFLEGADVIPFGADLTLVGVGARTNYRAVSELLEADAFGTDRVAVIRDTWDRSIGRLHLNNVLSVIGDSQVAIDSSILDLPHKRRMVDEWRRNSDGKYELAVELADLSQYLKECGIQVVPVTLKDSESLDSIVNLGNGRLVSDSQSIADSIKGSDSFQGSIDVIGNGSAHGFHSSLAVLNRTVSSSSRTPHEQPTTLGVWNRPTVLKELVETKPSQTTDSILMMAPTYFYSNDQAALDNFYMNNVKLTKQCARELAVKEYSELFYKLRDAGVHVFLFTHQPYHNTPDACFPNNWFSTHSAVESGGKRTICLWPMKVPNRRLERRPRVVETVDRAHEYAVFSLTDYEMAGEYLEGTGALCLDRVNKIAYVAKSERAHISVLNQWAKRLGYRTVTFTATDESYRPIYHTNVMMAVGTTLAVICLESIDNIDEREHVKQALESTGHELLVIDRRQVRHLCGNVIELRGFDHQNGKATSLLVMSTQSYNHFTDEQRATILKHVDQIVHADIPTIETIGGGGVRCTIAEVF